MVDIVSRTNVNKMPVCKRPIAGAYRFGCAIIGAGFVEHWIGRIKFKWKQKNAPANGILFAVLLLANSIALILAAVVDVHHNCRLNIVIVEIGDRMRINSHPCPPKCTKIRLKCPQKLLFYSVARCFLPFFTSELALFFSSTIYLIEWWNDFRVTISLHVISYLFIDF